jgi:hypothetical protein
VTTTHANDKEIQDYSLNNAVAPAIIDHIRNCSPCRAKAVQYTMMLEGIKGQSDPVFEFDLTRLVMAQLPVKSPKHSFGNYSLYPLLVLALLLVSILAYPLKNYLPGMVAGLTPILISLIVLTALVLSIFLSLDIYIKFKKKMDILNIQI